MSKEKVPTVVLFRRFRVDRSGGMFFKVKRQGAPQKEELELTIYACDQCDFIAKTKAGLAVHKRLKHNKKKNNIDGK